MRTRNEMIRAAISDWLLVGRWGVCMRVMCVAGGAAGAGAVGAVLLCLLLHC